MRKDHVGRQLDQAGTRRTDTSTTELLSRLYRAIAFIEKRLATKGKHAAQRANAAREAIADDPLPGLSHEDRKVLVGLLRRMLVAFEANNDKRQSNKV